MIVYGLGWLLSVTAFKLLTQADSPRAKLVRRFLTGPALAMAAILTMNAVGLNLGLGFGAQTLVNVRPVSTLILLWFLLAAVGLTRDLYAQRLKETDFFAACSFCWLVSFAFPCETESHDRILMARDK